MKITFVRWLTFLLALLLSPSFDARADDADQLVKTAKAATAMVVIRDDFGVGSAFCIDATNGWFVTNCHVIDDVPPGVLVELILNPSEPDERSIGAHVLVKDRDTDLAIIKADTPKNLTALRVGDEVGLHETQQLTALGYPFGSDLTLPGRKYPNVSVNVARISALRKSEKKLELIQIDSQLNPGNSGGPLIDAKGSVVGIISSGIVGRGINFAIPIGRLRELTERPTITLVEPTSITTEKRSQPISFVATVAWFGKPPPKYKVQLQLEAREDKRAIDMSPMSNDPTRFTVRAAPVPPSKETPRLNVSAEFSGGSLRGDVADTALKLDNQAVKLSEVERIERDGETITITRRHGDSLVGKRISPATLTAGIGGQTMQIDLTKIAILTVAEPDAGPSRIKWRIVVSRDGKEPASTSGEIAFRDEAEKPETPEATAPNPEPEPKPAPAPPESKEPPATSSVTERSTTGLPPAQGEPTFKEDQLVVKLPEPAERWTLGGGGRYLVVYFKAAQKVALYDLLSGEVAHEISKVSEDVLLACGRENLFLVLPGQKLVQRWDLKTFKREKIFSLPGKGTTHHALIGSNSNGPLLLAADDTLLVDPSNMHELNTDGGIIGVGRDYSVHVSPDGQSFAGIVRGIGPVSYNLMRLRGTSSERHDFDSTSYAYRWARPTADGSLVFLAGGGAPIYSRNLWKLESRWLDGATMFPTVDPRYFIAIRFADNAKKKHRDTQVCICTVADRRIVYTFTGLPEMAPGNGENDGFEINCQLSSDPDHFFYTPSMNVLAVMDWGNKKLILTKLDLLAALKEQGTDYLFVDSVPPDMAAPGKTLLYPIHVVSKSGGAKFTLESGPAGMTVSNDGVVRWNVPRGFDDDTAKAVVSITDAGGEELLHAFEMKISSDKPANPPRPEKKRR